MPSVVSIHLTLRMRVKQFTKFETIFRMFYHNELHCCIQGTMELKSASNTPEFLLHHTFMDKLWYDWQGKGPEYKFKLRDNMEARLRGSHYTVAQFMDSFNMVGGSAVYYEDPFPGYKHLHHTLRRMPLAVLSMLDSYNQRSSKTCCPRTMQEIKTKIKEIKETRKMMKMQVAKDYGNSV